MHPRLSARMLHVGLIKSGQFALVGAMEMSILLYAVVLAGIGNVLAFYLVVVLLSQTGEVDCST